MKRKTLETDHDSANEQMQRNKEPCNIQATSQTNHFSHVHIAVKGDKALLKQQAYASTHSIPTWDEVGDIDYGNDPLRDKSRIEEFLKEALGDDDENSDHNINKGIKKPIKKSKKRQAKECDAFAENALEGVRHWKLNDSEEKSLLNLLGTHGYGGAMRASDRVLRAALSDFVVDEVCAFGKKARKASSKKHFYWLTFICDRAISTDRNTNVDIYAMKERVQHALRNYTPFSAIGFVEIQAVTNFPGRGLGRALMVHAHVLAWSDQPFSYKDIKKRARGFKSSAATPIHIKMANNTTKDFARIGAYMSKMPLKGKVIKKPKEPSKKTYLYQTEIVRPNLHLRLMEILSHIPARRLIFSVSEGQGIRTKIINKLEHWHKHKLRAHKKRFALPYEKVGAFWKRVRTKNKTTLYQPPIVITERITQGDQ
jgi:hypothetical protein